MAYAKLYDSLQNVPAKDRPDQTIIDNDEQFDAWYEHYVTKLALGQSSGGDPKYNIEVFSG